MRNVCAFCGAPFQPDSQDCDEGMAECQCGAFWVFNYTTRRWAMAEPEKSASVPDVTGFPGKDEAWPTRGPFVLVTNGIFGPEPVEFVPDVQGNPPVRRALIPADGESCRCPRCRPPKGEQVVRVPGSAARKGSAMILPPLDARDVKSRVDFVALAGRFTRLRRSGRQFIGLCPLHRERHPSFYVDSRRWYCFGCCRGGDVFAFVIAATGCTFRRALEIVHAFSSGDFSGVAGRSRAKRGDSVPGVGASPGPAQRGIPHSQECRASILARLDATNRRVRVVEALNAAASRELATGCEPGRVESLLFTCTQRISRNGGERGERC